jgi:hypothetical protein
MARWSVIASELDGPLRDALRLAATERGAPPDRWHEYADLRSFGVGCACVRRDARLVREGDDGITARSRDIALAFGLSPSTVRSRLDRLPDVSDDDEPTTDPAVLRFRRELARRSGTAAFASAA